MNFIFISVFLAPLFIHSQEIPPSAENTFDMSSVVSALATGTPKSADARDGASSGASSGSHRYCPYVPRTDSGVLFPGSGLRARLSRLRQCSHVANPFPTQQSEAATDTPCSMSTTEENK